MPALKAPRAALLFAGFLALSACGDGGGAILTPPDWVSQVLLGIPMVFLYLLGVGAAWLFGGARRGSASTSALRLPGR